MRRGLITWFIVALYVAHHVTSHTNILLDHYNHVCNENIEEYQLEKYLLKSSQVSFWHKICSQKWVEWKTFTDAYRYDDEHDISQPGTQLHFRQYFGMQKNGAQGYINIPTTHLCVTSAPGFVHEAGLLICGREYVQVFSTINENLNSFKYQQGLVIQHSQRLFSLLSDSDKTNHFDGEYDAFTRGLSKLAILYPLMLASPISQVLCPPGPLQSLLRLLDVEDSRIIINPDQYTFHYSADATMVYHNNINNTHPTKNGLPLGYLSKIRKKIVTALSALTIVGDAASKPDPAVRYIIYLQRSLDGVHPCLIGQRKLLSMLRRVLLPKFEILVLGGKSCRFRKPSPFEWMTSASLFRQAEAVIAVTDVGSPVLCDTDSLFAQAAFLADEQTAFVEILHRSAFPPIKPDAAFGVHGNLEVNNILHSKAMSTKHWLVQTNPVGTESSTVDAAEILQILAGARVVAYDSSKLDILHFNTSLHPVFARKQMRRRPNAKAT